MAYIQPTSEVWLCANVPLDPSYDNQLTFTSGSGATRVWDSAAQRAYFASKAVYHPQNYSIVKERDGVLRMSGEVSQFYNINYMYFVNPPFGTGITSKYFYAFVTQVEYVNPNTTFIYFELDYFQTWAADIVWMESVIEREHVEHDEMYANLEDEGIEVNDLEPYAEEYLDDALGQKILVVGATESYSQILTTIQNEGLLIHYYPYDRDYPVYNNYENKRKSEKVTDLKCYKAGDLITYSNAIYNYDTNELKIMGLEDVNIDTIYFTFNYIGTYNYTWYVKGERVGSEWQFSQDGIRINYNPSSDYPQILQPSAVTLAQILQCYTDSTYQAFTKSTFNLERPGGVDYRDMVIIVGGVPDTVNKVYFDVRTPTPYQGSSYWSVKGQKSMDTWTFSEWVIGE